MMKIATWNVNSLKVRLTQVLDWLKDTQCDVLGIQELKCDNEHFPQNAFEELGYHVAFNGQKTYNGVAIISKYPITDICYDMPDYNDIQKRVITVTICDIRIICAYVVNGEAIDSDKFQYKLSWLDELYNHTQNMLNLHNRVILLGDFNIAPSDIDVYDSAMWQDKVLCSDMERSWWTKLLSLELYDSFRLFSNEPKQYTWWDYRNFAFKRKLGLRIDHILISPPLKDIACGCTIDTNPRKNERPSDHTPVILTLNHLNTK